MTEPFNIFAEIHRLGATNTESDLSVQIGIAYHIGQATNDNIMDVIKICNIIEAIGIDNDSYVQACNTLNLVPFIQG